MQPGALYPRNLSPFCQGIDQLVFWREQGYFQAHHAIGYARIFMKIRIQRRLLFHRPFSNGCDHSFHAADQVIGIVCETRIAFRENADRFGMKTVFGFA